jgi:predicted 3-demethylubiquinone-9 3-methyltransferase (glyoxalase superfamily)
MYDNCEEHVNSQLIPSLMFTGPNNGKAKEAMELYTSLFPASSIGSINTYGTM